MRIAMLGPLEVQAQPGQPVEVGGARLRALLIRLALEPDRVVSHANLVDAVWADDPPAAAGNALQALVSRLRRALPEGAVASHPSGYRLAVAAGAVDVGRFERLVADGRAALDTDPGTAAATLRDALALWRGPALADVADAAFAVAPVARLSELRHAATEDRIEAELRLGAGASLVPELESLVAEQPLRERLVGQLMRALCAAGRPAQALAAYERARAALADTLGADPPAELTALHVAVLRGELPPTGTSRTGTPRHDTPPTDTPSAGRHPGGGAPDPGGGPDSAGRPRSNLRAALTSFVGRDDEVPRVAKLVGECRLTTLIGPGGAGKTRLAIESARAVADQCPDGVWLVELAPVTDASEVAQAVLSVLGVRDQSLLGGPPRLAAAEQEPTARLVTRLSGQRVVLVLDNCEHLVAAAADLADRLLAECPHLRVLATSREPLGITGETLWPVEPLALPPAHADPAEASSYASVRLLADRARAVRPDFDIDPGTVAAAVDICRALDGMPLAIELAAARLRALTPAQIAARLDDRFRLLAGGSRTALPRHQTLRAVVDWSWDLLDGAERALWRRLSVFSGGTTLETAERICAGGELPADEVFRRLIGLVDKSLLVATGDGRYTMLETIRAYGLARLAESGEEPRVRRAHAEGFLALLEAADPAMRTGDQTHWMTRLTAEHDNLHAAMRWAIAAGEAELAVRFGATMGWYWWLSGHRGEGAELGEQAVNVPGDRPLEAAAVSYAFAGLNLVGGGSTDPGRGRALMARAAAMAAQSPRRSPILRLVGPLSQLFEDGFGESALPAMEDLFDDPDPWLRAVARLMHAHGELNVGLPDGPAEVNFLAALDGFRSTGERWGMSSCLAALADLLSRRGDHARAAQCLQEALATIAPLGTDEDLPQMQARLAHAHWLLGERDEARRVLEEAQRVAERVRVDECLASVAYEASELLRAEGQVAQARNRLAASAELVSHLNVAPQWRAMIATSFGYLAAAEGRLDAARAHHDEALELALGSYDAPVIGHVLVGLADLALRRGRPAGAATLLGAAVGVRGGPDRSLLDVDRLEAAAREALGEAAFAEAYARGRAVPVDEIRELVTVTLDA